MSTLKATLTGYALYRGREGQLSFVLHRLTGLGVLMFLIIHILDTSTVYFFPSLYEHAIALYRSTPFMLGEILLVFCVFYHGVNGIRIAVLDLYLPQRWSIESARESARWALIISVILWLPAAIWMMRNLLVHNFGWLGG
jgi:succinate dehydrogenase / fumarate reductase cytochrome b subunit